MTATAVSQYPRRILPGTASTLPWFCLWLLAVPLSLGAATTFYVDSGWNGMQSGTTLEPWKALSSSAWTAINSALASGDVTVYFSARQAASDADDIYDANGDGAQDAIDLTQRRNAGSSVLTLDGNSMYNTSETAPYWMAYSGKSKSRVRYLTAQNSSHLKHSNITLHGFHVVTTDGNKEIAICGDNWIVENCECEHTSTASDGPGILLVPTADRPHEGSTDYAPVLTNIVIRNNTVHDTYGEAVYIGGGGVMDGTPGAGYPSHSNITIEGNVIYNAGIWGDQGDGIDVKGGIRNLTIRANEIYNINFHNGVRAIVMQGQLAGASQTTMIERNRIHDCSAITDAAIAVVDSWGTPQGVCLRNNVIYNIGPASASGIMVYNSQDSTAIYNNTISGCGSLALLSYARVSVMNNLVFNNNDGGPQVAFVGGAAQCDYNAYGGSWGYAPAGGSSLSLTASDLANTVTSAATGDFTLKAGSPVIGKAKVLTGFSNDAPSKSRGAFWDIGAFQHTSSLSQSSQPPARLRVAAP